MSNQSNNFQAAIRRRDFIKIVILSGFSITTVNLIKHLGIESIDSVLAIPDIDPYYYGTDTSWAVDTKGVNASNFPQDFYIGRTGVGELIYNDSSFFSVAADKAGYSCTHTYWNLKGPYYYARGNRTRYQYGFDQATVAASAWYDHYWSGKIGGKTIFADIEAEPNYNDGWRDSNGSYNVSYNQAVLEGYLDGIVSYSRNGYNPGLTLVFTLASTFGIHGLGEQIITLSDLMLFGLEVVHANLVVLHADLVLQPRPKRIICSTLRKTLLLENIKPLSGNSIFQSVLHLIVPTITFLLRMDILDLRR